MEGEVSSTQALRIESVGRVVSQRKTKVLFTRIKERQMLNGKKPKTTTLCFKQAASYYAYHKQGESHLLAFQTISPLCCPSPPFPHQILNDRAPVQPEKLCQTLEIPIGQRPLGTVIRLVGTGHRETEGHVRVLRQRQGTVSCSPFAGGSTDCFRGQSLREGMSLTR